MKLGFAGCVCAAALLIGGLANLDRRPVLSGVLFGILTIKPQLGLLLPLVLVLTGRWRTIFAAAASAAAMVAATSLLYGPEIWTAYLKQVVPMQHYLQEHGRGMLFLTIPSSFYAVRLLGFSISVAWAVQALFSAVAVAAVIWTFWRRRDEVLSMAVLVTAIFLASPYTMNYDMVVFGWVLALLRQRTRLEGIDDYLVRIVWALPALMMVVGLLHVPIAPLVLAAFGGRLLWQLRQQEAMQVRGVCPAEPVAA